MLDILAAHPSTARFIATKLARRFVADTPPAALVDRAAARFRETDGDLREVVRAILTSPEFLVARRLPREGEDAARVRRQRAARDRRRRRRAARRSRDAAQLGMPLYFCQPPTGYKDTAEAWVNTGALVSRMNFALALATGRAPRACWSIRGAIGQPTGRAMTGDSASRTGGRRLASDARDDGAGRPTAPQVLALALGSPEFQRR